MLRISRIMESLPTNAERRAVAFEVWRSFGGPLVDLKREVERERKQAQRDAREDGSNVPLLSQSCPGSVPEILGQTWSIPPTPPTPAVVAFQLPESIKAALKKCEILGRFAGLWTPGFWRAEVRAFPELDYAQVILEAEAFVHSSPAHRPKKRACQFMHRQLQRAADRAEP